MFHKATFLAFQRSVQKLLLNNKNKELVGPRANIRGSIQQSLYTIENSRKENQIAIDYDDLSDKIAFTISSVGYWLWIIARSRCQWNGLEHWFTIYLNFHNGTEVGCSQQQLAKWENEDRRIEGMKAITQSWRPYFFFIKELEALFLGHPESYSSIQEAPTCTPAPFYHVIM